MKPPVVWVRRPTQLGLTSSLRQATSWIMGCRRLIRLPVIISLCIDRGWDYSAGLHQPEKVNSTHCLSSAAVTDDKLIRQIMKLLTDDMADVQMARARLIYRWPG